MTKTTQRRVYLFGLSVGAVRQQAADTTAGVEAVSSHVEGQCRQRDCEVGIAWVFEMSKLVPNDNLLRGHTF